MSLVKITANGQTFAIKASDDKNYGVEQATHVAAGGLDSDVRKTELTGIGDAIDGTLAFDKLKGLIPSLAQQFSDCVKQIPVSTKPEKVKLELVFELSAKTGLWVVSGDAKAGIKVCFEW